MKRIIFLLAILVGVAHASEVKVRLYWIQAPSQIRLLPRGATLVRRCPSCRSQPLQQPLEVAADGARLRISSQEAVSRLRVTGSYAIEVSGGSLQLDYPLELRASGRRLRLDLRLPLEDYVAAVLAGESSSFRSDESLKAMAVAVRTYAVHFRGRHRAEGFDFCDTTHCQDLRLGAVSPRWRAAAEATQGELLWYRGEPAATYYHRHCGGTTESARYLDPTLAAPYLRQQADSFCVARDRGEWHGEISGQDLRRALVAAGIQVPARIDAVEIGQRTPSGRAEQVRLVGSYSVTVAAAWFRLAVGRALGWERIRSDLYDVRASGDHFIFHGYGAGHGVGLCQAGAAVMGEEGRSYREILAFYYPGTTLGLTAQGLPWQALAGERLELLTTQPGQDQRLLARAERLHRDLERQTGWSFPQKPQLRVYPTLNSFRDATGEPGWVAASTRGRVIRLQPWQRLRDTGALDSTLRHELLHLLVEHRAHSGLPRWFREGVVLYIEDGRPGSPAGARFSSADSLDLALTQPHSQAELAQAYAAARSRVARLVEQRGRETVLGWLDRGLPADLLVEAAGDAGGRRR